MRKVLLAALALLALTPAGSQAFVVQEVGGLNSPASGIVLGPDGNIWAGEEAAKSVARVAPSGTILGQIPVGSEPASMAAGPGGRVWATLPESHELVWFDATSPTPTAHHVNLGPAKCGPVGIADGDNGSMYFTMPTDGICTTELGRVNADGSGFTSTPTPAGNGFDLVALNGKLFVPNPENDVVSRVAASNLAMEAIVNVPAGSSPEGIAADGAGNLWVTLYLSGKLAYFPAAAASGSNATTLTPTGGSLIEPFGIVGGADGKMYTPSGGSKLLAATALPTFEFTQLPAKSEPWDIANGPSGDLWITDLASTRLLRLYNPPPPSPPAPSTTTTAPVATVKPAPKLSLSGKSKQQLGGFVQLKVSCPASPCSVSATGVLKIKPAGKGAQTQPKLTAVKNLQVPAGKQAVLKLKVPAKAKEAAAKALAEKGGKVSAAITLKGKVAGANSPTAAFKVTLKK